MKLQSLIRNSKNSNLKYTDFNLFYFFTSLSLSVLSMNFKISLSFERGCKGTLFF